MTTKQAFKHLISEKGWHKPLGINDSTATSLKFNFGQGLVKEDKMRAILKKAKYKLTPESWDKP